MQLETDRKGGAKLPAAALPSAVSELHCIKYASRLLCIQALVLRDIKLKSIPQAISIP